MTSTYMSDHDRHLAEKQKFIDVFRNVVADALTDVLGPADARLAAGVVVNSLPPDELAEKGARFSTWKDTHARNAEAQRLAVRVLRETERLLYGHGSGAFPSRTCHVPGAPRWIRIIVDRLNDAGC
jgi:hypothetical protein